MATALCIPRRFVLMFRFACLLSGWSILFAHSTGIQPERWWRGSLQVYAAWLGLHGVGLMRANKRLRALETYFHHRAEETESKVHGQVEQYAEVDDDKSVSSAPPSSAAESVPECFTMQGIYLAGVYPLFYFEEDLRYEFAAQQIYLVRG